eukprot:350899-Chlamydomonas_euryale.AAC.4
MLIAPPQPAVQAMRGNLPESVTITVTNVFVFRFHTAAGRLRHNTRRKRQPINLHPHMCAVSKKSSEG